jgi:N-acetylglucosaminyl-diphospho-decaprenol L-rhamnosyltransferase
VVSAISAIIPTLDGGSLLVRCLDALAAAGVDEVLVLDGGSTDGGPQRAAARPGVRVLELPGTSVQARINRGVEEARHEMVLLLDDDAFVDPPAPALLAAALAEGPRVALVGAALRWEDGSEQRSLGRYRTLLNETLLTLPAGRHAWARVASPVATRKATGVDRATWLPLCCAMARRSAFLEVGGFDERYSFYYDDQDFCRRMEEAGWELAVRWDAGAVHVGGGVTSARDPSRWFGRYQDNRLRYLRKWYPRGWRVFAAAWAARACVHAALWTLRALLRALRADADGARTARGWARTFLRGALPRRPETRC